MQPATTGQGPLKGKDTRENGQRKAKDDDLDPLLDPRFGPNRDLCRFGHQDVLRGQNIVKISQNKAFKLPIRTARRCK